MIGSIGLFEILLLGWSILCVILFFKIWGACNDIKRLAEKYAPIAKGKFDTREDIDKWLNGNNVK